MVKLNLSLFLIFLVAKTWADPLVGRFSSSLDTSPFDRVIERSRSAFCSGADYSDESGQECLRRFIQTYRNAFPETWNSYWSSLSNSVRETINGACPSTVISDNYFRCLIGATQNNRENIPNHTDTYRALENSWGRFRAIEIGLQACSVYEVPNCSREFTAQNPDTYTSAADSSESEEDIPTLGVTAVVDAPSHLRRRRRQQRESRRDRAPPGPMCQIENNDGTSARCEMHVGVAFRGCEYANTPCLANVLSNMLNMGEQVQTIGQTLGRAPAQIFGNLLKSRLIESILHRSHLYLGFTGSACSTPPNTPSVLRNCPGVAGDAIWQKSLGRLQQICENTAPRPRHRRLVARHHRLAQDARAYRCERNARVIKSKLCDASPGNRARYYNLSFVGRSQESVTQERRREELTDFLTTCSSYPISNVLRQEISRARDQSTGTTVQSRLPSREDFNQILSEANIQCSRNLSGLNDRYSEMLQRLPIFKPPRGLAAYQIDQLVPQSDLERQMLTADNIEEMESRMHAFYQEQHNNILEENLGEICDEDFDNSRLATLTPLVENVRRDLERDPESLMGMDPSVLGHFRESYDNMVGCFNRYHEARQTVFSTARFFTLGCMGIGGLALLNPVTAGPGALALEACGVADTALTANNYFNNSSWSDVIVNLDRHFGEEAVPESALEQAREVQGLIVDLTLEGTAVAISGVVKAAASAPEIYTGLRNLLIRTRNALRAEGTLSEAQIALRLERATIAYAEETPAVRQVLDNMNEVETAVVRDTIASPPPVEYPSLRLSSDLGEEVPQAMRDSIRSTADNTLTASPTQGFDTSRITELGNLRDPHMRAVGNEIEEALQNRQMIRSYTEDFLTEVADRMARSGNSEDAARLARGDFNPQIAEQVIRERMQRMGYNNIPEIHPQGTRNVQYQGHLSHTEFNDMLMNDGPPIDIEHADGFHGQFSHLFQIDYARFALERSSAQGRVVLQGAGDLTSRAGRTTREFIQAIASPAERNHRLWFLLFDDNVGLFNTPHFVRDHLTNRLSMP